MEVLRSLLDENRQYRYLKPRHKNQNHQHMKRSLERTNKMFAVCLVGILLGGLLMWVNWPAVYERDFAEFLLGGLFIFVSIVAISLYIRERNAWKNFLKEATSEDLSPKRTIALIEEAGEFEARQIILQHCIQYRIERSGNYAWGLAFWVWESSNILPMDCLKWIMSIIHYELGLKLHAKLDDVREQIEKGGKDLSHPENQEFAANLIKKDIAMMLEVCGEDRPYASIIPILAEASPAVREEIMKKAREGREFPKDADLTDQMMQAAKEVYDELLDTIEEKLRTWPTAEPVS